MDRFVLAIDQGTTGSRALIVDSSGHIVAAPTRSSPSTTRSPAGSSTTRRRSGRRPSAVVRRALAAAELAPDRMAAIGITNQRETTVVWDRRTGRRSTTRSSGSAAARPRSATASRPAGRAGRPPPHRARPRRLLLGHQDRVAPRARAGLQARAAAGELAFGTIDSWLIGPLTGGRCTSPTTPTPRARCCSTSTRATGTTELLELLGVPRGHAAGGRALRPACSARPPPRCSGPRSRSPASRATSRRPSSARPASTPGR